MKTLVRIEITRLSRSAITLPVCDHRVELFNLPQSNLDQSLLMTGSENRITAGASDLQILSYFLLDVEAVEL
jgi:hypothetical protein